MALPDLFTEPAPNTSNRRNAMYFRDRRDAAIKLAQKLQAYKDASDTVVLAIPRGAVPIGAYLAKELNVPLDLLLVKKVGFPGNKEFAIGAASLTDSFVDERYARGIPKSYLSEEIKNVQNKLDMYKNEFYSEGTKPRDLKGKVCIVVDDGIATGKTVEMGIRLLRKHEPKRIVIAVPVAPEDTLERMAKQKLADEIVCVSAPKDFAAIGQFYFDFSQVHAKDAVKMFRDTNLQSTSE